MKSIAITFCVLFMTLTVFNQTNSLKESLQDLKKDLSKNSRHGIAKKDSTIFRTDKFDGCEVSFYYVLPNQNPTTFIEFDPISSSTGTFNTGSNVKTPNNNSNPVFIPDRQNNGTVARNESLSRNNRTNKDNDEFKQPTKFRETLFNFKFVPMDSILISATNEKNFFLLTFDLKETTTEYKINEKFTIYLKTDSIKKAEETLVKFKNVASICQESTK